MNVADVRYIDQVTSDTGLVNYLFRGPYATSPDNIKQWNHTELMRGLAMAAAAANVELPAVYFVCDISLLTVEWANLYSEATFYQQHPQLGVFSHWPQFGSNLDPAAFEPSTRTFIEQHSPQPYGDYLPALMKTLRLGMESSMAPPPASFDPPKQPPYLDPATLTKNVSIVFYIHCLGGKDRTGQVSAAYYLQWLAMSFNDALYYDNACVGANRSIAPQLLYGTQWFCLQLQKNTTGNCLIQNPSPPSLPCSSLLPSSSS